MESIKALKGPMLAFCCNIAILPFNKASLLAKSFSQSYRSALFLRNTVPAVSQKKRNIYSITSMLNPVSHMVNIKWLLLYSCAPVTQTKHVFQWEMQQFSICAPRTRQALKATDNHRQRQFDYSWVVLKFSQSWTWGRSQRQLHAPSARHTLHPALSPLLTPYITPLTSRSSCYNPCVTSVLTEKGKKNKNQQPCKFISISLTQQTVQGNKKKTPTVYSTITCRRQHCELKQVVQDAVVKVL